MTGSIATAELHTHASTGGLGSECSEHDFAVVCRARWKPTELLRDFSELTRSDIDISRTTKRTIPGRSANLHKIAVSIQNPELKTESFHS